MNEPVKGLLPSTMMQGFMKFLRMKGYQVSAVNAGNALAALDALGRPATFIRARGVARSVFAYDADSWHDFNSLWDEYWLAIAASSKIEANAEAEPGEQEWMIYDLSPDEMKLLQSRLESETARLDSEMNAQEESRLKDSDLERHKLEKEAGQTSEGEEKSVARTQEDEGPGKDDAMQAEKNFAGDPSAERETGQKNDQSRTAQAQQETESDVPKKDTPPSTEAAFSSINKEQEKEGDSALASQSREGDLAGSEADQRSAEGTPGGKNDEPSKDPCISQESKKASQGESNEAEKQTGADSAKDAESKSVEQAEAKDEESNESANAMDGGEEKQSESGALPGQKDGDKSEEEGAALGMEGLLPSASMADGDGGSQSRPSDASEANKGGGGDEQGSGASGPSSKGLGSSTGGEDGSQGGAPQLAPAPAERISSPEGLQKSQGSQSGQLSSNAQKSGGAGRGDSLIPGEPQGNANAASFAGGSETGMQQALGNQEGTAEGNEGLSEATGTLAQPGSSEGAEGQKGNQERDRRAASRPVEGQRQGNSSGSLAQDKDPQRSGIQAANKDSMSRANATSLDIAERNARNYASLLEIASRRDGAKGSETDNVLSMMTRLTLAIDRMTDSERREGYRGEILEDKSIDRVLKGVELIPGHPPVQGGLYGQGNYGNIIDGLDNISDCRRIRNLARQVALALRFRPSRRYENSRRGRVLDCRKTIRKSLETGGDFYELAYRKRKDRRTRITTLLDVSGSMMNYYKFLLYFTQGLISGGLRPESIIFNTKLRCVTELMRKRDLESAAKRMPLGGGTLIAASLEGLLKYHGGRFLGDHVSLFIISDGMDGEYSDRLPEAIGKLRPHTRNIVWLTPQSNRNMWPAALSMAEEKMDLVSSISSIQDMKELVKKLKKIK